MIFGETHRDGLIKRTTELIQRQLSHAIGDKVRQSYDDSTLLDERRKFMIAWCDALLAQGMKI